MSSALVINAYLAIWDVAEDSFVTDVFILNELSSQSITGFPSWSFPFTIFNVKCPSNDSNADTDIFEKSIPNKYS